jgi:uncharacterized protein (TIGR02646 family)
MIKIFRPAMPHILKVHQQEWTKTLVNLVNQYGGYDKIPETKKKPAVNKYQHDDIKKTIQQMSHGKCVFCEEIIETVSYAHIEHFYPKSIYYKKTFKWENLLSACCKCNISKGDHDTKKYPIVNPEKDEPEKYFIYQDIRIHPAPHSPDIDKSQLTIDVCDLHRLSLFRPKAKILLQFYETERLLKEKINEYDNLKRKADKIKRLNKIHDALENLKAESADTEPYAGFLRYTLKTNKVVESAINLINAHKNELGLSKGFELY